MWDQWLEAALEKKTDAHSDGAVGFYGLEWWRWILILLGIVTLTAGVVITIQMTRAEPVRSSTDSLIASTSAKPAISSRKKLFVDISGAVKHPGLYELEAGARAGDAVTAAGGLATQAHQVYLRKHFNSATLLTDGQKLYIPFSGEDLEGTSVVGTSDSSAPAAASELVSLNTASSSQLDALPGIGAVRVEQIIAGRPYASLEELVERKIVTASIFEDLNGLIAL